MHFESWCVLYLSKRTKEWLRSKRSELQGTKSRAVIGGAASANLGSLKWDSGSFFWVVQKSRVQHADPVAKSKSGSVESVYN